MASGKKQIQLLARQFFKLSAADGALSADRVAGVLAYVEKHFGSFEKPVEPSA